MSEENKNKASVVIQLEYPISMGKETITSIELKRPKGRHIKGLGKDVSMKEIFDIASKISGHAPVVFDEMDAVDCFKVSEEVANFLASGREILKTV